MTNREAIEILKAYKQRLENSCSNQLDKDIKAFDIAIGVLNRDGTIPYENDESTVCVCPVCGSVWNIKEANNEQTTN